MDELEGTKFIANTIKENLSKADTPLILAAAMDFLKTVIELQLEQEIELSLAMADAVEFGIN